MTAHLIDAKIRTYSLLYSRFAWTRLVSCLGVVSGWGFMVAAGVLMSGRTLVFPDDERVALRLAGLYGADALIASVAQLRAIAEHQKQDPVPDPGLQAVFTGGSSFTPGLVADVCLYVSRNLLVAYGSTEAGITAVTEVIELARDPTSIGFVTPWTEIEICDEQGAKLPPGSEGELRIRPVYGLPRTFGEDAAPQWFHPGDRAVQDEAGRLVIRGRVNEILNIGGVKLAPEFVDDIARTHPHVAEAAAFAFAAPDGATQLGIAFVPRAGFEVDAVSAWCQVKRLPLAKALVLDALPKTALGKVRREELAALAAQEA